MRNYIMFFASIFLCLNISAQSTIYSPLYTNVTFSKSINLSNPVGTIAGSSTVSPTGAASYNIPVIRFSVPTPWIKILFTY